jgi:hypothetical protein
VKREWKPGDVAMVTYRLGQCTESNVCAKTDKGWDCLAPGVGFLLHGDVIEVRPLVVIDPEDHDQVERLRSSLESMSFSLWACGAATCLTTALREFANPTPPKPDEPTGLGAVVEDAEGRRWLRFDANTGGWPWIHDGPLDSRKYDAITAVRVLSDGVQP